MFRVERQKVYTAAALSAIMLYALFLRLWHWTARPMETRDGVTYIEFIERLQAEGTAAFPPYLQIQPPLFVYLSWKLTSCGVSAESAALIVNIAAGVLLLIPVYFLGKLLFKSAKAGLMSAGIAAVMPMLVRFSCQRLRESLYLLFVFCAGCCWTYAVRRVCPKRNFFLCGLFGAVSVFCRYEGSELLLLGALAVPSALLETPRVRNFVFAALAFAAGVFAGYLLMRSLPGMPDIFLILFNRVKLFCFVRRYKFF